jgi:hypothetical protein
MAFAKLKACLRAAAASTFDQDVAPLHLKVNIL